MHTLLFQAHLKPCYWVEALHTATYLYNWRPCCPLQLSTPYKSLFFQQLIILICAHLIAYVSLISVPLHQTNSLLAVVCMFLGYPREHKGYRCIDLSSNKIITSRHVLFYETNFPLASKKISLDWPQPCASTWDPSAPSLDLAPVRQGSSMAHHPRSSPRVHNQLSDNLGPNPTSPPGFLSSSHSATQTNPQLAITTSPAPSGMGSPHSATATHSSPSASPLHSTIIPASSPRLFKHPIQAPRTICTHVLRLTFLFLRSILTFLPHILFLIFRLTIVVHLRILIG
jgi:hypothetical protein